MSDSFSNLKKFRSLGGKEVNEEFRGRGPNRPNYYDWDQEAQEVRDYLEGLQDQVASEEEKLKDLKSKVKHLHKELKIVENRLARQNETLLVSEKLARLKAFALNQGLPIFGAISYYNGLYDKADFSASKLFWAIISYYLVLYSPNLLALLQKKGSKG